MSVSSGLRSENGTRAHQEEHQRSQNGQDARCLGNFISFAKTGQKTPSPVHCILEVMCISDSKRYVGLLGVHHFSIVFPRFLCIHHLGLAEPR